MRRKFPFALALFFLAILILFIGIFNEILYSSLKKNLQPFLDSPPPVALPAVLIAPLPPQPPPPTVNTSDVHVLVKCSGRLGNLMFEWAATAAIAAQLHASPCLVCAESDMSYASYLEMTKIFERPPNVCPVSFEGAFPVRKEQGFGIYDPLLAEKSGVGSGIQIGEFLQSFKYWGGVPIQNVFTFQSSVKAASQTILQRTFAKDTIVVGVHVRRTDKVTYDAERHFIPTMSFFYSAMNLCRKKYGKHVRFLVMSDDIPWCHEQPVFRAPDVVISQPGKEAFEDFALLASTHHVILSMGTFAWWAGYLGHGDVYYHVEFNMNHTKHDGLIHLEDYYPDKWIRVL